MTSGGSVSAWLGQLKAGEEAALVRLHGKAVHIQARARQAGWDQALWESWLRALGYKHNIWPMQRLAELRPRISPPSQAHARDCDAAEPSKGGPASYRLSGAP